MRVSQTINPKVAIPFKALRRKIYVLPALFCVIIPALRLAQNNNIDSLKKVLPALLNTAGATYPGLLSSFADSYENIYVNSAEIFSMQSLNESLTINNKYCVSKALRVNVGVCYCSF